VTTLHRLCSTLRSPLLSLAAPLTCAGVLAAAMPSNEYARFERLSLDEGLSQSVVFAVLQDRQGFLWFSTQDGLNRFDGYSFKVFRPDPDDPRSISDKAIDSLLEDRSGVMWVGTERGLNRFDRETETFTRFLEKKAPHEASSAYRVFCLLEDSRRALWLGTSGGGLRRFDRATGRFQRWTNDPRDSRSLSHDDVKTIIEDSGGSLWIGTREGLNRFDGTSGLFQRYLHSESDPESIGSDWIWSLFEYAPGTLWVGTEEGVYEWKSSTGAFRRFSDGLPEKDSLGTAAVFHMIRSRTGEIWICTRRGVYRLSKDGKVRAHYSHNPADVHSLSVDNVVFAMEDNSGILWFGTYSGGVNKLDLKREQFVNFTAGQGGRQVLSDPSVWAFCEDRDGAIWVGTERGLDRLEPGGTVTHYRHDAGVPGSLLNDVIQTLYQDNAGRLWVGNVGGLDCLETPQGRSFRHYRHDPRQSTSISSNDILAIRQDSYGSLWVGTYDGGLNLVDPVSGVCRRFQHDSGDPTSLSDDFVTCLWEDRNRVLWVGTNGGLDRFDRDKSVFIHHAHEPGNSSSLSDNRIRCFHEDRAGRFWVGTGGGLNLMNRTDGTCVRFTVKDGLSNDVIYGILEDAAGCLWMSTSRGLTRFDPARKQFRTYEAMDGLLSNEFNMGAYVRLRNGEMLFGGISGFTRFRPEAIRDNPHVPPVLFTDFRTFGKSVKFDRPLSALDEVTLSYRESPFTFEFAALDFTNPGKNRYSYKLEGLDEEWIDNGTSRVATYTNIDGGRYVFRVRGSNNDGVWNEAGASVRLTVVPPFYRTAWFRVLAILVIAAALNLAYFAGRRIVTAMIYWKKTSFIGHFRTLEVLGKGGMGTVYKAVNIVTKEIVALKVLNEELRDESDQKRFIQEGLVCERIRHPSIVQIFERGEHNGRFYYSMEYIDGVSLRALMEDSPLSPACAMMVFSVVLDIVRDIHAAGIIHRDLKPENIMLKKGFDLSALTKVRKPLDLLRRNLRILDFGIAKFVGTQSLTQTGMLAGTLLYTPPEILAGDKSAEESYDFYSLGMMLREMLTGSTAFRGMEPAKAMYAILNQEPSSLRGENPDLPQDISELVDKLIERDVATRLRDYAAIRGMTDGILETLLPGTVATADRSL